MSSFNNLSTSAADFTEIRCMEFDAVDTTKLLVADKNALVISDGAASPTVVAGDVANAGYADGGGAGKNQTNDVRFNTITAFVQIGTTEVIIIDSRNYCIRKLIRSTSLVTLVVGLCEISGNSIGVGSAARLGEMGSAIEDPLTTGKIWFADITNKIIRTLNVSTKAVANVATLSNPASVTSMAWSSPIAANPILIMIEAGLIVQKTAIRSTSFFAHADITPHGAFGIVYLVDDLYAVSDLSAKKIVLFNKNNSETLTICDGTNSNTDGTVALCQVNSPSCLYYSNGILYIGADTKVRQLPGNGNCRKTT